MTEPGHIEPVHAPATHEPTRNKHERRFQENRCGLAEMRRDEQDPDRAEHESDREDNQRVERPRVGCPRHSDCVGDPFEEGSFSHFAEAPHTVEILPMGAVLISLGFRIHAGRSNRSDRLHDIIRSKTTG